ncbi:zinc-dependent peptidase [Trichloromonas sp.]|uniref:M90 family metallopeptidase n=1 Tax=Trichloromonas sp. TaxID=3069249 RepID=UPI003D81965C
MFHWFRDRRRDKTRKRPFPREWESFVRTNVAHYCVLDDAERAGLRALMQVFLEEKYWEGCGGLELTDEIRITIAAQACLLLLGIPHNYYRNVESILVYPSTVVIPERQPRVFERIMAPVETALPILGQAIAQGPVILVWDAVLHGAHNPEQGHNVVYHEFAHKLDMLDGSADGTPPLADPDQFAEWVTICSREFLRLRDLAAKGLPTFLDAYGAKNEAEFFAVATEEFFDRPLALQMQSPDLYHVLRAYYRQDPAERVHRSCPEEE